MVSHEYGGQNKRPHYHAIIFGWTPKDQKLKGYSKGGYPLFTSPELEQLWPFGFSDIGEANEKTAYYIAAYALKGKKHKIYDEDGEEHQVSDTFDCSKSPAIGRIFFEKNYRQMIDSKSLLPRYYQKILEKIDPDYLQIYEDRKMENFRQLDPIQKRSKYLIHRAKQSLQSNEFRKSALDDETDSFYLEYLKFQTKEIQ